MFSARKLTLSALTKTFTQPFFGFDKESLKLVAQTEIKLDVSGFSNGIYFIQLGADDKTYRARFVKN